LSPLGHTQIWSPQLTTGQKSLIKILDNTRSTYAFFAKKVVLVEGDTDRYFIKAVIQNLYRHLDQEIAILHIGGKLEFAKWTKLFSDFGLNVFAIADFDYLATLYYPNERGTSLTTPQAVSDFKTRNPDWETRILAEYANRVYILKEGDLEHYLSIQKDLDEVIAFCRDELASFLANTSSARSVEVQDILRRIVT
jgi:predicted ATP-dependent endonuclease of OLD family